MHRRIAQANIVFFNEEGFVAATGRLPSRHALAALLDDQPRTVVVTLGAAGAMAMDQAGFSAQPAFASTAADTTGAGDSFNAAWLCAFLAGQPLADSLRFACAAASFTVGAIGARPGLPDRSHVESKLGGAPAGPP
jgi:sugar/nucleoside kinase (ribokinase family)